MATHHAEPGEIVNLATWAGDLPEEKSKVIVKMEKMELARLVLPAGKVFPDHKVSGPIIVHCLSGKIEFSMPGSVQVLVAGQLLYLSPGEPHSLKGIEDAVVLLTIVLV